jgi:hypothetical protein
VTVGACTYASNSDVLFASVAENLGDGALFLELKVHLCLVRLDFDEHITGRY